MLADLDNLPEVVGRRHRAGDRPHIASTITSISIMGMTTIGQGGEIHRAGTKTIGVKLPVGAKTMVSSSQIDTSTVIYKPINDYKPKSTILCQPQHWVHYHQVRQGYQLRRAREQAEYLVCRCDSSVGDDYADRDHDRLRCFISCMTMVPWWRLLHQEDRRFRLRNVDGTLIEYWGYRWALFEITRGTSIWIRFLVCGVPSPSWSVPKLVGSRILPQAQQLLFHRMLSNCPAS